MKFFLVLAAVVAVAVARPRSATWTLHEISEALQNPAVNPAAVPYLEAALDAIMNGLFEGGQLESVQVALPAEVSVFQPSYDTWSLQEISLVLQNPDINPAAVPYFEEALNSIMETLSSGGPLQSILVPLPAEVPLYLTPLPAFPEVVPGLPVVPAPVLTAPEVAASPIVQVVVNVNNA